MLKKDDNAFCISLCKEMCWLSLTLCYLSVTFKSNVISFMYWNCVQQLKANVSLEIVQIQIWVSFFFLNYFVTYIYVCVLVHTFTYLMRRNDMWKYRQYKIFGLKPALPSIAEIPLPVLFINSPALKEFPPVRNKI